jgi:hypothetical protein
MLEVGALHRRPCGTTQGWPLHFWLQQAFVLQCKPQQRVGAFTIQIELAANIRAMVLHRPVVDRKLGADLFAGVAQGYEAHHPAFCGRETTEPWMVIIGRGGCRPLQELRCDV